MSALPDSQRVIVRPARSGDEQAIFELIRELAQFEELEHQLVGSQEKLGACLFSSPPAASALVAVEEENVVGYALFFSTFSTFLTQPGLWLEDLYVTAALRGRGIGQRLFQAVVEVAKERGAGRLEWSVLDWNEKAISFYRSRGAEILPDWRICRMTASQWNEPR